MDKNKKNGSYALRRTVVWGDCDPAGIIYTPRVFDYATETLEAFFRDVLGVNWADLNWKLHLGSPTVSAQCEFLKPMKPDLVIDVSVAVEKIGNSSVIFVMDGRDEAGAHYFRATYVTCFIARPDFKSTPIPDSFREKMIAYQGVGGGV